MKPKLKEEKIEEEVVEGEETVEEESVASELKTLLKKASGELTESLKAEILDSVEKQLEEHKRMAKNQVGIYNQDVQNAEKRVAINDKFKTLLSNILRNKDLSTDADASPYGGYVVDSELSAEIRHLITEYGVARRESLTLQLSKPSYKANNLATDVSVYYVDEGGAIKSSQVVLGQETLELKKLAVIATLTSELIDDEEIDLFGFIATRVAEAFAKEEDLAFFAGDGTATYGSFTGLLSNTSVNEVTMTGATFASIDADDLIDMVDETPQGALANSKFYLHRTIMSYIRKLKDDNGAYIYQAPSVQGPATIWGYPVVLVEAMPDKDDTDGETSFVLFGDLKKATIFGYKGSMEAKRFDAGTVRNTANDGDLNLITSDREAIRWIERFGFVVIVPSAVTKLTTASASA